MSDVNNEGDTPACAAAARTYGKWVAPSKGGYTVEPGRRDPKKASRPPKTPASATTTRRPGA